MKLRRKITLGLGLAAVLFALFLTVMHFRAKGALAAYKKQLRAQGEKLTIEELIPPKPTNGPNGAPALMEAAAQLGDCGYLLRPEMMKCVSPGRARVAWMQPVLVSSESRNVWSHLRSGVETNQAALAEIRSALELPILHFDVDYRSDPEQWTSHLPALHRTMTWLSVATIHELHEGRSEAARRDLRALTLFAAHYRGEPFLRSQYFRKGVIHMAALATWEALQYSGWEDEKWGELQDIWRSIRVFDGVEAAFALEAAHKMELYSKARRSDQEFYSMTQIWNPTMCEFGKAVVRDPKFGVLQLLLRLPARSLWQGWWSYEAELWSLKRNRVSIDASREALTNGVSASAMQRMTNALGHLGEPQERFFISYEESSESPAGTFGWFARDESLKDMVVTAIALRRFRMKHGDYPAELSMLIPGYLTELPRDFMDGKPLRYRPQEDAEFLLYSVGFDGTDNGGSTTPVPGTRNDKERGFYWLSGRDWFWPMPATAEQIEADNLEMESYYEKYHRSRDDRD